MAFIQASLEQQSFNNMINYKSYWGFVNFYHWNVYTAGIMAEKNDIK